MAVSVEVAGSRRRGSRCQVRSSLEMEQQKKFEISSAMGCSRCLRCQAWSSLEMEQQKRLEISSAME